MTQEEQSDDAVQTETATGEAGQRLKKAREAKNLSLQAIAEQLKSSVKMIEALEAEDSSSLPQAIYVSGYLRSYAGIVGLPAAEIISAYPNLTTLDPVLPSFKKGNSVGKFEGSRVGKRFGFKLKLVLIVVILGVVIAGGIFYLKQDSVKSFVSDVVTEKLDIRPLAENESSLAMVDEQPAVVPVIRATTRPAAISAVSVNPVSTNTSDVEPESSAVIEPQVPVEPVKTSRLLLEFAEESWVEVTDARGERLAYRLAKAPSRRLLEGVAPFKVFIGYAPGVTVNYNGLPFDLASHVDGDVAQMKIGKDADNELRVSQ